jgi:hypothetical protein
MEVTGAKKFDAVAFDGGQPGWFHRQLNIGQAL